MCLVATTLRSWECGGIKGTGCDILPCQSAHTKVGHHDTVVLVQPLLECLNISWITSDLNACMSLIKVSTQETLSQIFAKQIPKQENCKPTSFLHAIYIQDSGWNKSHVKTNSCKNGIWSQDERMMCENLLTCNHQTRAKSKTLTTRSLKFIGLQHPFTHTGSVYITSADHQKWQWLSFGKKQLQIWLVLEIVSKAYRTPLPALANIEGVTEII